MAFVMQFGLMNAQFSYRPTHRVPDTNPIKNLRHELKEYVRREVKPLNNQELVTGIINIWKSVDEKMNCSSKKGAA